MYQEPYQQPQRNSVNPLIVVVLLILVGFLLWRSFFSTRGRPVNNPDYQARVVTPRGDLAEDEATTIDLFREVSPSVVYITTSNVRRDRFSLNLLEIPRGTGSGFIYDEAGHIVTNYHVLLNADTATVTLANQQTLRATLVGREEDHDLAVLRIDVPEGGLRPIMVGSSNDLQVGQKVFAIGNPFGLDQTLTTGVISGLGREIKSISEHTISGVIQTDAAINPGNSGGPLLDSAGRLIGVNTAIYSPSGAYAGIGFAVPVDTVNRIVPELIRYGRVARPVIGIQVDDQLPRRMGISGVMVMGVYPNSGAEQAGLRATHYDQRGNPVMGDIVVSIDGQAIEDSESLLDAIQQHEVGDVVEVTVLRDGQQLTVDVTVQAQ